MLDPTPLLPPVRPSLFTFLPLLLLALQTPTDAAVLPAQGPLPRNMWCTAGFLHAAHRTVLPDGAIVPLTQTTRPVFTFDPIHVECQPNGITRWRDDPSSTNRFILHVRQPDRYPAAMTRAMKALLQNLR